MITKSQLFRWQRKYKNGDVAGLIDTRGGHNRGKTDIPPDAWEYFYALYMTLQKRSIEICWEYTKTEYPEIPSVSAFERKVKTIPEPVIIFYRKAKKRSMIPLYVWNEARKTSTPMTSGFLTTI